MYECFFVRVCVAFFSFCFLVLLCDCVLFVLLCVLLCVFLMFRRMGKKKRSSKLTILPVFLLFLGWREPGLGHGPRHEKQGQDEHQGA